MWAQYWRKFESRIELDERIIDRSLENMSSFSIDEPVNFKVMSTSKIYEAIFMSFSYEAHIISGIIFNIWGCETFFDWWARLSDTFEI